MSTLQENHIDITGFSHSSDFSATACTALAMRKTEDNIFIKRLEDGYMEILKACQHKALEDERAYQVDDNIKNIKAAHDQVGCWVCCECLSGLKGSVSYHIALVPAMIKAFGSPFICHSNVD